MSTPVTALDHIQRSLDELRASIKTDRSQADYYRQRALDYDRAVAFNKALARQYEDIIDKVRA